MAGYRDQLIAGLKGLKTFDDDPQFIQQVDKLQDGLKGECDLSAFTCGLYDLLCNPKYTLIISECFPKLILQILTDNISLTPLKSTNVDCDVLDEHSHVKNCVLLSKMISHHPDVMQFCLLYFAEYPSPFEWNSSNNYTAKRRKMTISNTVTDLELTQCCYNFLNHAPDIFRDKWRWSKFFSKYLHNENDEIKWLIIQCISIVTGMAEFHVRNLEKSLVANSETVRKCLLKYCNEEQVRLNESTIPVQFDSLNVCSDYIVDVSGILLPVYDNNNKTESNLVPVKSTMDNLRSLALAVASRKAVCLTGPVGCGKTALVENLARLTGRNQQNLKKIQLGDQTDSRSLLGTYRCSDIPGEFIWQPGVLTKAVQQGQWILLEDIDCAALDVASVLSSLLERNILSVPGYRDSIPIAPGFQIFVTKRMLGSGKSGQHKLVSNATALLEKHWTLINVEPLSRRELISIVEKLYPQLSTISTRLVDIFLKFSVGSHQSSLHNTAMDNDEKRIQISQIDAELLIHLSKSGRLTSTRDLLKLCRRAVMDFDVTSQDSALKVLQDAIDIFICSIPDPTSRLQVAKSIGDYLSILDSKTEYYCFKSKPTLTIIPDSLQIGRVTIPRIDSDVIAHSLNEKKVTFSYTLQSLCLLERITCCIQMKEPVLLVGETGTGKTSCIQYLAKETGHKLIVINMNQQSDSADLLGGYKPVDLKFVISPIRNEFEQLFRNYFDGLKNGTFLKHISDTFNRSDWKNLLKLMQHTQQVALKRLKINETDPKEDANKKLDIYNKWYKLGLKLSKLEVQLKNKASLAFSFIEGSLIKALKEGHWVLLDEINLASAETLECLSGLLEGQDSSISLIERGDDAPIKRHENFTLFACMNPATDVGKRDLPAGLRNRFTEFFIDELSDKNDLILLIGDYLKVMSIKQSVVESIYRFYSNIVKESKLNLMDGTGQSPHYSLRTLCRALAAAPLTFCGTVTRSLYETMCLSFLTQLDSISHPKVEKMIADAVIGSKSTKSILEQRIPMPNSKTGETFLNFEGYWICQGKLKPVIPEDYILTPSVRKNLRDITRIISLGKLPILLQGDTSVGKTSLISYLAKASGNQCVRINNHQHTDLQEYIGSYATDVSGKLIFKEGILVEAMRKGYWIILDELNLAPTDVLEALNRVLDDNKELFIPETQQIVKADPKFMLFATQNPPGLYGGRKLLSRAFKNRFVELHFDEIPKSELEVIMHQRCHMPLSYCKKVLAVMSELQVRRRGSAAVQGKEGFITLRDLFRWGQRYKIASNYETTVGKYYDWDQHIADEGYLVLAGRVRQFDERLVIQEVLEKHIKRKVSPENLFSLHENTSTVTREILDRLMNFHSKEFGHVVWTFNMRRLAVLITKAFNFKEPVLLVGETGCGKTTVCQVLAALRETRLITVNCHMHTESSDFLGGLRPVRHYENDGKLFEWVDGPLINSMKDGQLFLADEISLADDSVLERLNSLLEPEREILLAEKGISMDDNTVCAVSATEDFRFIATMNPGGDYGKKELSPALRNRFTEIWCDHITTYEDTYAVLQRSLNPTMNTTNFDICASIINFVNWFKTTKVGERLPCNIRDLLSWTNFINEVVRIHKLNIHEAYLHGAALVFLDCFGTSISGAESDVDLYELKKTAVSYLISRMTGYNARNIHKVKSILLSEQNEFAGQSNGDIFGFDPFYIKCGQHKYNQPDNFSFMAPTTGLNTLRILRGLQLKKPILLEGSPGVGKTSLVTALAKISGHRVLRINLSDQTDVSDLFGADLPTAEGTFAWKNGAFLTALQNGDWILLDELNLAPQPVLEGLNACFDHRGEIFISELGRTFHVKMDTRIFACQNPLKQGGARRGLPKSFLNRFTQVYIDTLSSEDLLFITHSQYPNIPKEILAKMIEFNSRILKETNELLWGYKGSPWELNLRDIQRWCDGITQDSSNAVKPGKFAKLLYIDRMRTGYDKDQVKFAYMDIFGAEYPLSEENPAFYITQDLVHIGDAKLKRNVDEINKNLFNNKKLLLLRSQLPVLKSIMQCVEMNWLAILIGPTASGKSSCVQTLAELMGRELKILPVTSAMDTTDILGGFEQTDYNRHLENISNRAENMVMFCTQQLLLKDKKNSTDLLEHWELFKSLDRSNSVENQTMEYERNLYLKKHEHIRKVLENLRKILADEECLKEIDELMCKLKHIHSMIEKEKSINASGKFEWVDSLLVKCLIEGSWLLIDNVNLCSSAVLDRLNGLLETHGVLSVPERGDDVLNEIKPHPNFRIFFTMDPKNGEISRAMRNRGVEIYIIGMDDHVGKSYTDVIPLLDLRGLLYNSGLPSIYHRLFISIHNLMSSYVENYEKPTQYHLLQAASLTWQQIQRGENPAESIINSFSDIYIKSRTMFKFNAENQSLAEYKNNMFQALTDYVGSNFSERLIDDCYNIRSSLTIRSLSQHLKLERIKQDSFFLNMSLLDELNPETFKKMIYLFYNYYNTSTFSDVFLRYEYVNNLIHSFKSDDRELLRLNKTLFLAVKTYNSRNSVQYPWNPQILNEINAIDENDSANKLTGFLFLLSAVIMRNYVNPKLNHMSIMDYSKDVLCDAVTDDFNNMPLLKNCSKLIRMIEDHLKNVLNHPEICFTNENLCELIAMIGWIDRFHSSCNESMYEVINVNGKKKRVLNETSLKNLILHYKWLLKNTIKPINKLVNHHLPTDHIENLIGIIDRSIAAENSPFKSISRHMNASLGQVVVYSSPEEFDECSKRNKHFRDDLRIKILSRNFKESDINRLKPTNYSNATLENIFGIPNQDYMNTVLNNETIEDIDEKNSQSKERIYRFMYEAQTWPLKDMMIRKLLTVLRNLSLRHSSDESNIFERLDAENHSLIRHACCVFKYNDFVPSRLVSLFSYLANDGFNLDTLKDLTKYAADIEYALNDYNEKSPLMHSAYWLNWNSQIIAEKDEFIRRNAEELLPPHLAHLTSIVVQLSLRDNIHIKDKNSEDIVPEALLQWKQRSKQLKSLQHLIWKNMATLTSPYHRQLIIDCESILVDFTRTVNALNAILMKKFKHYQSPESEFNPSELVEKCIEYINQLYSKDNHYTREMLDIKANFNSNLQRCCSLYHDLKQFSEEYIRRDYLASPSDDENIEILFKIGSMKSQLALCNITIYSEIGTVDVVKKDRLKLSYANADLKTYESLMDVDSLYGILHGTVQVPNNLMEEILKWSSDELIPNIEGFDKGSIHRGLRNKFVTDLMSKKSIVDDKISKNNKSIVYRPTVPTYADLSKEFNYFVLSLGSYKNSYKHYVDMHDTIQELLGTQHKPDVVQRATDAVKKYDIWKYSIKNFINKFAQSFSDVFPDLAIPFLNSIYQLINGLDMLKTCSVKLITKLKFDGSATTNAFMENLVRFPIIDTDCLNIVDVINLYSSRGFLELLERNDSSDIVKNTECYRLLKISLQEVKSLCVTNNEMDADTWMLLQLILNEFVIMWQKQQDMIRKKKEEEDSLYVMKTQTFDMNDDEDIEGEINEMFPSYVDADFTDFRNTQLTTDTKKPDNAKDKSVDKDLFFMQKDIDLIVTLHSRLIKDFTPAEWLPILRGTKLSADYLTPLLARYETFNALLGNTFYGLSDNLDSQLLTSLLILITNARHRVDGTISENCSNDKANFYHTPWIEETNKCLPTLKTIKERTYELLDLWPDFPTLKDIIIVTDRILNFPITSPVARFLTGLELLRDKVQDWNESAHKGNNMKDLSLSLAEHIISWRRLELSGWKDSLNDSFEKIQSGANKWWFHIFTLIDGFINETTSLDLHTDIISDKKNETINKDELTASLQQFIEKSPLGEFQKRLDMLFTFHCHVIHHESTPKRDQIMIILWNLYKYYSQFSDHVAKIVKEKRAPIEKKLRDFVKICTWERDLSYWAVKDIVSKAQKTLHRHIKEFENILKGEVVQYLIVDSSYQQTETYSLRYRPKLTKSKTSSNNNAKQEQHYLITPAMIKKYTNVSIQSECKLLSRTESLSQKAKNICKTIMTSVAYPNLIQSMDEMVTQIINTVTYLQSQEVTASLPKEKQLSQAKGFLHQKKKALSDLFRNLLRLGISYKTGLMENTKRNGIIVDFEVPPVDIEHLMSYIKDKKCDTALLSMWHGCELYYQRCVSRFKLLSLTLPTPSAELGIPNIERIKGFSTQFMIMVQNQKCALPKQTHNLCRLRYLINQIIELSNTDALLPDQNTALNHLKSLKTIYYTVVMTLEQFYLLLKTHPGDLTSDDTNYDMAFDIALDYNLIMKSGKFDKAWMEVMDRTSHILAVSSRQRDALNAVQQNLPSILTYSKKYNSTMDLIMPGQSEVMDAAFAALPNIKSEITIIINRFAMQNCKIVNPMIKSLMHLSNYLEKSIADYRRLNTDSQSSEDAIRLVYHTSSSELTEQIEDLVSFALLIMQDIFKKSSLKEEVDVKPENDENEDNEDDFSILENHLKTELLDKINSNLIDLHLSQLNLKLYSVISKLTFVNNEEQSISKNELVGCIPIFEQIALFSQYYITQQIGTYRVSCKMLSVILNIFNELTAKGFCSNLNMEEDKNSNEKGSLAGGMGMAEGEGVKDVSEEIKDQDQLDTAQRPGEEKNEEDRDCDEEEKGINMGEDFDSHLQDVKDKEDQDKDDDSDDDCDKQMGDTENNADKLDQQLWGSDDEDDEPEKENKDKEEKGSGKAMGDKQLEAKEDGTNDDETADDKNVGRKEKKNEINEEEYDDDQVDPYHGNQQPLPEPEAMDLPDDLDMDDNEENNDQNEDGDDKNPFEIDVMKDKNPPEEDEKADDSETKDKNTDEKNQDLDFSDEDNDAEDKNEPGDTEEPKPSENDEIEEETGDIPNPETEETPIEEKVEEPVPQIPDRSKDTENQEEKETPEKENPENMNEDAKPSHDQPTDENNAESADANDGSKDLVQTNPEIDQDKKAAPKEQTQEQDGKEQDGIGQSELSNEQQGHTSNRKDRPQNNAEKNTSNDERQPQKRNKPGMTEEERLLGKTTEPVKKKSKTLNTKDENKLDEEEADGADENKDGEDVDVYQHVTQAKENDTQVIDAATKEQAEKQPVPNKPEEDAETPEPDQDIEMDTTEDVEELEEPETMNSENVGKSKDDKKDGKSNKGDNQDDVGNTAVEVEGDNVETFGVQRGSDTSYHTKMDMMETMHSSADTFETTPANIQQSLQTLAYSRVNEGDSSAWHSLWGRTSSEARMLTEKLRLVLEPTGLSRLAGDYRTGKRINMRRVIPYIASHFRKDRIWLRRTRPAKREYHVAVAIDDSSSMSDNQSKELAFESLALISQALNLLEAGDFSVLSFGEDTKILHSFSEQFTENSGSKLLQNFTFKQTKTRIAQMLDFAAVMFDELCSFSSAPNAKLLLIVSDGRSIFSEGETKVLQTVRKIRESGVFIVYLIVDNPNNKESIMDIRVPVFDPITNQLKHIRPYLDSFPFPFYLILRNIAALPSVLSDAMRQWFELAANMDRC